MNSVGSASGFLLTISGQRIYFACDTAFFGDMSYYAKGVDLAVLPIGDLFDGNLGFHPCHKNHRAENGTTLSLRDLATHRS